MIKLKMCPHQMWNVNSPAMHQIDVNTIPPQTHNNAKTYAHTKLGKFFLYSRRFHSSMQKKKRKRTVENEEDDGKRKLRKHVRYNRKETNNKFKTKIIAIFSPVLIFYVFNGLHWRLNCMYGCVCVWHIVRGHTKMMGNQPQQQRTANSEKNNFCFTYLSPWNKQMVTSMCQMSLNGRTVQTHQHARNPHKIMSSIVCVWPWVSVCVCESTNVYECAGVSVCVSEYAKCTVKEFLRRNSPPTQIMSPTYVCLTTSSSSWTSFHHYGALANSHFDLQSHSYCASGAACPMRTNLKLQRPCSCHTSTFAELSFSTSRTHNNSWCCVRIQCVSEHGAHIPITYEIRLTVVSGVTAAS